MRTEFIVRRTGFTFKMSYNNNNIKNDELCTQMNCVQHTRTHIMYSVTTIGPNCILKASGKGRITQVVGGFFAIHPYDVGLKHK